MKKLSCFVLISILVFCTLTSSVIALPTQSSNVDIVLDTSIQLTKEDIPEKLSNVIKTGKTKHRVRLFEEEKNELCNVVYLNQDGSKTLYSFEKPIKYIDKHGKERDKSIKLNQSSETYYTTQNDVVVSISKNAKNGVSIKFKDFSLEMKPITPSEIISKACFREESNLVDYNNIFGNNVKLQYTPTYDGIKEDIILEKYTGLNTFKFHLYTHGLVIKQDEDGCTYLTDKKSNVIAELSKIFIYDSASNTSIGNLNVKTLKKNELYELEITVEKAFLESKDTVYPVVVDPTIQVGSGISGIKHAMLYRNYGNIPKICTYLSEIRHTIGTYNQDRGVGRQLISFPGLYESTAFLSGGFIKSVKYYQYYTPGNQNSTTINAYLNNTSWNPDTVTYNNFTYNYDTSSVKNVAFGTPSDSQPTLSTLDMTEFAWYWKKNSNTSQKGLYINNQYEYDETKCIIFMANEVNQYTYHYTPYVVMEYETKKIMLDAGHRVLRNTQGIAYGENQSPIVPAYVEAERMWILQSYLKAELQGYGFTVGQTRTTENEWLDPNRYNGRDAFLRGEKAKTYDLFISLHSNAVSDSTVNRVVVIKPLNSGTIPLMTNLGVEIKNLMGVSGYQLYMKASDSDPNIEWYAVMRGAKSVNCPLYCIIEHSFHTNANAANWLLNDQNLRKLAKIEAKIIAKNYRN